MLRLKYDYEMLKNICDAGGVTLLENYKDKFITRDARIIGKCILCENSFNKSLNNLHKQRNFGCESCAFAAPAEMICTRSSLALIEMAPAASLVAKMAASVNLLLSPHAAPHRWRIREQERYSCGASFLL